MNQKNTHPFWHIFLTIQGWHFQSDKNCQTFPRLFISFRWLNLHFLQIWFFFHFAIQPNLWPFQIFDPQFPENLFYHNEGQPCCYQDYFRTQFSQLGSPSNRSEFYNFCTITLFCTPTQTLDQLFSIKENKPCRARVHPLFVLAKSVVSALLTVPWYRLLLFVSDSSVKCNICEFSNCTYNLQHTHKQMVDTVKLGLDMYIGK